MTVRQMLQVIVPAAGYYSEPENPGSLETEILYGEMLEQVGQRGEYLKVQSPLYSSAGYVHRDTVSFREIVSTHRVSAPFAHVYYHPRFKSGVRCTLSMNSLVKIVGGGSSPEGEMIHLDALGWVFADQLMRAEERQHDYVEVALSRVGKAPYGWGMRTHPDCSALVMDALLACGIPCPRNVSEQAVQLGTLVDFAEDFSDLQKGDFVFWNDPGTRGRHVAIITNIRDCVHATIAAPYRGTVKQSLSVVIRDQERDGNGRPTMVRRFTNYRL